MEKASERKQLVETEDLPSEHVIETSTEHFPQDPENPSAEHTTGTTIEDTCKVQLMEPVTENSPEEKLVEIATEDMPKRNLIETAEENSCNLQVMETTPENMPNLQIVENATEASSIYQYILPFGQELQEDQQLAVELTSDDGIKYLYILSDQGQEQKKSIDSGHLTSCMNMINNSKNNQVGKGSMLKNLKQEVAVDRESKQITQSKQGEINDTCSFNQMTKHSKPEDFGIGVSFSEKIDKVKDKFDLKQIENRSCGTMTEDIYMETEKEDKNELPHEVKLTGNMQGGDSKEGLLDNPVKHKVKNTTCDTKTPGQQVIKNTIMNTPFAGNSQSKTSESDIRVNNEMKFNKHQDAKLIRKKCRNSTNISVEKRPTNFIDEQEKCNRDQESTDSDKLDKISDEDNEHLGDLIQLDNVDDETCKEILATIEHANGLKEKIEETCSDRNQNFREKFKYEKPRTRNMSKFQKKENIVDVKNGKNGKNRKKFSCDKCGKVYLKNTTLQEHLKNHSNDSYSCNICSKIFNSQKKLNSHVKRHSNEQPYLCDICGKTFRVKETYQNHMYSHSDNDEKPFKCDICGIAFIRQHYLTRHATCHTGEKPFECKECHKRFRTNGDLQRHDRLHGEKPDVKQFKCGICGKRFCAETGLVRHERAHKGEKPYTCDLCSKSFSMPGDLKRHVKTHYGGDYLPCDLCDKVLTSKVGFKRHQRMHSGEKPYQCKTCNNRFIDLWGLSKHQQLHKHFSMTIRQNQCQSNIKLNQDQLHDMKNCENLID